MLETDKFYDPARPFMDIYPKNTISYFRDICSTKSITALFSIMRQCNPPKCLPADNRW